jgi:hypothetical protein
LVSDDDEWSWSLKIISPIYALVHFYISTKKIVYILFIHTSPWCCEQ